LRPLRRLAGCLAPFQAQLGGVSASRLIGRAIRLLFHVRPTIMCPAARGAAGGAALRGADGRYYGRKIAECRGGAIAARSAGLIPLPSRPLRGAGGASAL